MAGMAYTPVQNGERTPYGGGGAGKMRSRRAPKRNGTPYDRPAQGRHASAGPQAAALIGANGAAVDGAKRDGWLGARLLGTASKIVTSSASYLYSSIFKRPAGGGPLLLTDVEKPAVDNVEGQVDMLSPSAAEAESMEAGSQHGEEEKSASEVESWMKRTFPREEADRLIASLRSYVKENGTAEEQADNANKEEQRRIALPNQVPALESAPSNGQLSDAQRWREERTKARQEQNSILWAGGPAKENGTPTGAGPSETGEIVAVDVARAYMGERVSRVVTPARVTLTREKVGTPLRLSPYQPSPYLLRKQQGTSISTQYESASVATPFGIPAPVGVRGRDGGLDENLRTPPLSRTVGRLLPASRTNVPSSAIGYPLLGEGSKKRGSAALEDGGYSSGGPMRQRPRPSLYTPSPASGYKRSRGPGMYPPPPRILQTPVDAKQKSISMWSRNVDTEEKNNVINAQHGKEDTGVSAMGANASVPERASATARKILETLDMMTPSPKEKSLDTELALVRERPPTELTTSMINDKARQTMQSWDFPGPQVSEEAGPSGRGRNLENDLSSAAGFLWKGAEQGTKSRGKGKAPVPTPSHTFEEKNADHPSFSFQDTSRVKVSESSLANPSPAVGRSKGFQINADVDDSDEETRGANLLTTSVTSTIPFTAGKSAPSGAGLFDNNPPRSLNVTAPMFGAPVTVESQRTTTEITLIEGKSNLASGGFTFPSSNPFGSSLEPPPTPKPFPSPSNAGAAAKPNGLPSYKFNTGPQMFKLPVTGTGGGDSAQVGEMKSNHQLDSKYDFLPSVVSVPETSQPFSTNPAESTRGEDPSLLSLSGAEIPTPPSISTAFTSSTISLANFGASGAGAKPGIFNQTTSFTGSSSAQLMTSTSNVDTSIFNFGKAPSSSPASESAMLTSASAGAAPSLFGSSTVASSAATTTSPVFGSSATFGSNKSPFSFGAAASSAPAAPIQTTAPSATPDDGNRPQKRMFGSEQTPTDDASAAPTVSFGLSAAATTSTSAPAGTGFTVPAFGQGASSSASSNSTSLFGLKPTSTDSTPSTSSSPSPSLGTGAFDSTTAFGSSSPFGSSTFGSSNATPLFGGASSTPTFGASSTPAFGGSSTPAFGASSTPAFGASSTPAFGASSTPAFGASSTPAFGASNTPAFGASSTPAFGGSSTPAFGGSSTPAFGASSTPAFGGTSTPAFGGSSTPAFGASSTPAFGASSAPAFGASAATSKAFGGFGTEASPQPSPSPSGFAGFGTPTTPASASSPTTFSFGANAGSAPTFNFGASSAASPTTPTGVFAFGASSAASPGSPFNFGAKPAAASPPMFGTASPAPAFGSTPNGSDMEDTMADDGQMMSSSPPPQQQTSLFGAPQTPAGTFQFGNPATPAATPSPVFGGFGNTGTPAGANPFAATPQQATPVANPFAASPQQGQPLNFGGGGFALGSSGQDQGAKPAAGRKYIKAKRAGSVKRK